MLSFRAFARILMLFSLLLFIGFSRPIILSIRIKKPQTTTFALKPAAIILQY